MLKKLDKAIISLISRDIPLAKEPYKDMAVRLGMEEEALLRRIRSYKKDGLMRKLTAILNHKRIGFEHNAMVVWNVPENIINKAGNIMASFGQVSHCYQRVKRPGWDYNLYSMVHGRTKKECMDVIRKMSSKIGRGIAWKALFSSKEEKKTGARYFS